MSDARRNFASRVLIPNTPPLTPYYVGIALLVAVLVAVTTDAILRRRHKLLRSQPDRQRLLQQG